MGRPKGSKNKVEVKVEETAEVKPVAEEVVLAEEVEFKMPKMAPPLVKDEEEAAKWAAVGGKTLVGKHPITGEPVYV